MLACQRHAFSLPERLHYLNAAYMAPQARAVEAAGMAAILRRRVPSRMTPADFFVDSDRARSAFARLIGVPDPKRVAIVPSASYGLAVVARNLPIRSGQNIVVLHEQFPSNVYAWRRLCQTSGATVRTVATPESTPGRGRRWNERLLDAIDRETALVAVPHVHWAEGTRFELAAVGRRAREMGAAFVIDGTQSIGAHPFSLEEIRPDAVVCAAYKWLLGPYSFGFAYFGERFEDGVPLEETWISREGSDDFRRLVHYTDAYVPGALRYDVGERSNFILTPMAIAGLELVLEWQPPRIQEYCAALTAELVSEARTLGFFLEDDEYRASHLFGIRIPDGIEPDRVATQLAAHEVSASLRGRCLRIAPHVYNTGDDVAALAAVLRDLT